MKHIFSQLFYEVEKRRDTVLVTLIADRGSAPRKAGDQMLVGAEGRLAGTIGGPPPPPASVPRPSGGRRPGRR